MDSGLSIAVEDIDPDYVGLTIRAWNDRFSGSTYVYVSPAELREFAGSLDGFPSSPLDERVFEFGKRREEHFAGGYCQLQFRYPGAVDVYIEEDTQRFSESVLELRVRTEAAYVDRFVASVRTVQAAGFGCATLNASAHRSRVMRNTFDVLMPGLGLWRADCSSIVHRLCAERDISGRVVW